MLKNKFYRIRLVDEVSSKRFLIEVKDRWFTKWRVDHTISYRFGIKLEHRTTALTYIDEVMEESVVLYDSRKEK